MAPRGHRTSAARNTDIRVAFHVGIPAVRRGIAANLQPHDYYVSRLADGEDARMRGDAGTLSCTKLIPSMKSKPRRK
jgi:hypothetical protein